MVLLDVVTMAAALEAVDCIGLIYAQLHVLRFNALWMMANTSSSARYTGQFLIEIADSVSPDDGVASLKFQTEEHVLVALLVDSAF